MIFKIIIFAYRLKIDINKCIYVIYYNDIP